MNPLYSVGSRLRAYSRNAPPAGPESGRDFGSLPFRVNAASQNHWATAPGTHQCPLKPTKRRHPDGYQLAALWLSDDCNRFPTAVFVRNRTPGRGLTLSQVRQLTTG
jgi:hypothetical protein